jgi:hypothetical protein
LDKPLEEYTKLTSTLKISLNQELLPVATSFVENSAIAFGLSRTEALSLTLATEEIFSCLCRTVSDEDLLSIGCSHGGYCVRAEFSIPAADFNLKAFNLTTTLSPGEDSDLEEMGLLIASRSVDHFHIIEEPGAIRLLLVKEKKYPEVEAGTEVRTSPLKNHSIRTPDGEELKIFARLVASHYRDHIIPMDLKYPGKLVDMVRFGECQSLFVFDREGQIGGGILWRWAGAKTMECLGPYLFNQALDSGMANELLEACLKAIAKSKAIGLINRLPTQDLPVEQFESLGSLTFFSNDGASKILPAYFRQMEEDPGLVVWSHRDLADWLQGEYRRLVLPRSIQRMTPEGETVNRWSVLATDLDRFNQMATLRPIRFGSDAAENLAAHLNLLQKESFRRIFFELDLGASWQAGFAPALIHSGFLPRLVLPYAGIGDIAVFQWEAAC